MEKNVCIGNAVSKVKRFLSLSLVIIMLLGMCVTNVYAVSSYTINGKTIRYDDFSSSPGECWAYANNVYRKIWGTSFSSDFSDSNNMLRNLDDSQLKLTPTNLKNYVSRAALGSSLRICNSVNLHSHDGYISGQPGHNQIIVQKDANGFTVIQGGLSSSPYCNQQYYTWSSYCSTGWLGGTYGYIKYIKWPGAPAYNGNSSSSKPTLSNCNMPETITVGQTYSVHGTVSSSGGLTNVTAAVYDVNGNMKTGKSVNPGSTSYNVKDLDNYVYFNHLSPGVYTYKVSATNSAGTTSESKVFIVLAKSDTIKPGNYKIRPKTASGIYLGAANHSPDSGENICLTSQEYSNYQTFAISSAGGGYYTIKNRGSGKYLDVNGASSSSGANVQLWTKNSSNAQLWQILPTGAGYCFVPKCAINNCMDVSGGSLKSGTNIQAYTANLTAAQRFSLVKFSSAVGTKYTNLTVGKNRTATITASYQTSGSATVKFVCNYTKANISVSQGKWNNHAKQITVKGKKAGNTTLKIKLVNSKTNKVLATKSITVTVTG